MSNWRKGYFNAGSGAFPHHEGMEIWLKEDSGFTATGEDILTGERGNPDYMVEINLVINNKPIWSPLRYIELDEERRVEVHFEDFNEFDKRAREKCSTSYR